MYLNGNAPGAGPGRLITKISLVMKLTAVLLLAGCLQVSANSIAQTITISEKNAPLEKIFKQIEKQTSYVFFYDDHILQNARRVDVNIKNGSVEQVMQACLKDTQLNYQIVGNTIIVVVKPKAQPTVQTVQNRGLGETFIDVRGRVMNDDGDPIAGVTVTVKGTKQATFTNSQGEFTINNVERNAVLVFTGANVEILEVSVKDKRDLIVRLITKVNRLDEVQIIAYGSTTKRISTSNITTIKAAEIAKQPVNNPLLALEGRVPGLFITQSNGLPGSGVKVRIQGQNSIGFGNDPLYVIDGVPFTSQLLPSVGLIQGSSGSVINSDGQTYNVLGNPLSYINPSDIESIDILRDADATAIYGSRAANGAILITTKKGKAGQLKADANLQTGWGQVPKRLELLNTQEFIQLRRQAKRNDNLSISNTDYDINGFWDTTRYTDWQRELIGNISNYTNMQASLSGGTKNTQFLVGAGYYKETTVFPGDFSDRKTTLHFNINSLSNDQKLKFQISGSYMIDNNKLPNNDITSNALLLSPDAPPLYNDGTINWALSSTGSSTWTNPISKLYEVFNSKTNNLITNASLGYEIIPGLDIKGNFGYTNLQIDENQIGPLAAVAPDFRSGSSRYALYGNNNISSWIIEPQLSYKKTIGKGQLESIIGGTAQQNNSIGRRLAGNGYNSDEVLASIRSASSISIASDINFVYKYNAFFGRINYNLDNKYIFNLAARRDGSSRFGSENQFHNFGSIGTAWIFSNENGFKDIFSFVSFGKFRANYGTTGNDQIGEYLFLSLYSPVTANVGIPYQGISAVAPNGLSNPYLQWEQTKKLQVGVDIGLFNDRVLLNANYSNNESSNQLLNYPLPITAGFSSIKKNFPAKVLNKDWEFGLTTVNIKGKYGSWSSGVNLTVPKNRLVSFPGLESSSYSNSLVIGQPVSIVKLFEYDGVDPATGKFTFIDSRGNPTSAPNALTDKFVIGDPTPRFYGGLQNSFKYRSFELDILLQFVKQRGQGYMFGNIPGNKNANQPNWVLDENWQNPGDVKARQRFSSSYSSTGLTVPFNNVNTSDAAWIDASYIRVKNVSLSWQIPESLKDKMHIRNFRVYLLCQNLFTITRYKGLDPETLSSVSLPTLRVITMGIQVGL